MNDRPPRAEPGLDDTRQSRGLADVVDNKARPVAAAAGPERSERSGPAVRQAAMRISQLLLTPDTALEAFRVTRRLSLASADVGKVRGIVDRLNDALIGDTAAGHELVSRVWQALADEPGPQAPGRGGMRRSPSVEVISLPPASAIESARAAETPAPSAVHDEGTVVAPEARVARPWAMLGEEETAHAPASEAAITRFIRPDAASATPQDAAAVQPVLAARPTDDRDATHKLRPIALAPVAPLELTLDQHAALSAECDVYPAYRAQIQAKYNIPDTASRETVDRAWSARLVKDAALRRRWHERYQACRAALAPK
jgi:predicted nucleic acid-binding protein